MANNRLGFYEFFSGGGMARLGLGQRWECLFANDSCEKKARAYRSNFNGAPELLVDDVGSLSTSDLPGKPALVWASFPCQDLSLAGNGAGLKGERSGTFWPFWRLMEALVREGRGSPLIVLENVVGAITSNGGRDFCAILQAVSSAGYRVGSLVINAVHFVPQSRPRLFLLAVDSRMHVPLTLRSDSTNPHWHPKSLRSAQEELPSKLRDSWVWWHLPTPPAMHRTLDEIVESKPVGVEWHTAQETARLLNMMSPANRRKVDQANRLGKRIVGTIYRRTRPNRAGNKVQRAEVRFDQISGCLRTPVGGSSRQTILVVHRDIIRSRLLSSREAARLMGVPETYKLPENYTEAYHLMGDGLAVPVVRWLEQHLLYSLAASRMDASEAA